MGYRGQGLRGGRLGTIPRDVMDAALGMSTSPLTNAAKHAESPDVVVTVHTGSTGSRSRSRTADAGSPDVDDGDPHFGLR